VRLSCSLDLLSQISIERCRRLATRACVICTSASRRRSRDARRPLALSAARDLLSRVRAPHSATPGGTPGQRAFALPTDGDLRNASEAIGRIRGLPRAYFMAARGRDRRTVADRTPRVSVSDRAAAYGRHTNAQQDDRAAQRFRSDPVRSEPRRPLATHGRPRSARPPRDNDQETLPGGSRPADRSRSRQREPCYRACATCKAPTPGRATRAPRIRSPVRR